MAGRAVPSSWPRWRILRGLSPQAIPATPTFIVWDLVTVDTHGSFDPAFPNVVRPPIGGLYSCIVTITLQDPVVDGLLLQLRRGIVEYERATFSLPAGGFTQLTWQVEAAQRDTLAVQLDLPAPNTLTTAAFTGERAGI